MAPSHSLQEFLVHYTREDYRALCKIGSPPGLSQSRWPCEGLGLTSAASGGKEEILGCDWSAQPTNHTPDPILSSYYVKSVGSLLAQSTVFFEKRFK
jgi:hypothetical protein